ncbi:hypothetical protein AB205_0106090 [Aquarana catesbeiana]|uniref:Uncharacterized protein n=1 Tax=Aquarana catesbeiana TaxID=8400 RepID=A0A2G9QBC1_AQUCT|nr:hypothetical protein AB205_0106090 [Aquarana catesbeiana]
MWRKKRFMKWAKKYPQQVMWMLWKKKHFSQVQVPRSSSGRSWCAIGIYRRSRKTSMMWKKDSKT